MTDFDDFPDEDQVSAQNNFTDRDDFKNILIDAVEKPQLITERRVKVFYGAGGQGKSALKNDFFIKEYLKKSEDKDLIYTDRVDFEDQEKTRLADEALLRIAEDLIEKGKIPMPAFCLGFLRYRMQTSSEKSIQQDYPFLYKIKFIGSDVANEIFNTIVSSSLDLIATGSQMLPGVGFFTKKIAEKGHKKIVEWIQKSDAKKILGDIDELNSLQLQERLPKLLAYDINTYLKQDSSEEHPYPKKRIIIIFDGYETLWRNEANPDVDKDKWVRTLVERTKGVLFIFFGRDKIKWAEKNEAFEKILDQHLLKGLSDEDADRFLKLSNIDEEEIRKLIIERSKNVNTPEDGCLPYSLDLRINTYRNIKKTGKIPSSKDFNKNDEEILKHFFEHLPTHTANAIKALSLAPYIDEEIIELFVTNNYISPNTLSLKSLARYSFIKIHEGRAIMHGLMKDMATKQFQDEFSLRYKKVNQLLFKYFEDKLPATQQEINADIERYLDLASYHKEIVSKKEYIDWAWQKAIFYYGKDLYGSLTNILYKALIYFFQEKKNELGKEEIRPDDVTITEIHSVAEINYYLAGRYNWTDNYKEAEKYIEECIRTIDFLSPEQKLKESNISESIMNEFLKLIKLKENVF